jgi:sterol desaturase/sphingolipid hydroxylase (fatty acid hydroxylase superfamily)
VAYPMPAGFPDVVTDKLLALWSSRYPGMLAMITACTVLCLFSSQACNPGKVWWRNRGLLVDVCYWVALQCLAPYLRMGLMVAIAVVCMAFVSAADLNAYINNGRGPLSADSFWTQAALYLLASDFLLYWIHRGFHGVRLWRYHAIHHSAEDVDWTTAYRFHPINICFSTYMVDVIMLYLGVAPAVMLTLVPFQTMSAMFVHANLNWTLGPLKYVVATPVFHRWHHTTPDEGGDSNFAPTFALWDVLFGTFHMPSGELPAHYGVDDPQFPAGFLGQLAYPFTRSADASGAVAPPLSALPSGLGSAAPRSES